MAADAASASAAGFDRAPICARRRAGPAAEGFLERAGVATWTARDTSSLALVIHDYELAERATVRARERYQYGVANFLEVLDAERRLLEVQNDLADSETETATSLVAVYKALGGGWQVPEPEAPPG